MVAYFWLSFVVIKRVLILRFGGGNSIQLRPASWLLPDFLFFTAERKEENGAKAKNDSFCGQGTQQRAQNEWVVQ